MHRNFKTKHITAIFTKLNTLLTLFNLQYVQLIKMVLSLLLLKPETFSMAKPNYLDFTQEKYGLHLSYQPISIIH